MNEKPNIIGTIKGLQRPICVAVNGNIDTGMIAVLDQKQIGVYRFYEPEESSNEPRVIDIMEEEERQRKQEEKQFDQQLDDILVQFEGEGGKKRTRIRTRKQKQKHMRYYLRRNKSKKKFRLKTKKRAKKNNNVAHSKKNKEKGMK